MAAEDYLPWEQLGANDDIESPWSLDDPEYEDDYE